jgi:hypothetical protein
MLRYLILSKFNILMNAIIYFWFSDKNFFGWLRTQNAMKYHIKLDKLNNIFNRKKCLSEQSFLFEIVQAKRK